MVKFRMLLGILTFGLVLALMVTGAVAQETTGGLQGAIKDASGAVVAGAHVEVSGSSLEGKKSADTDNSGYYRFANLPPGTYTITVSAKGFSTVKREGIGLEVGHLPTMDITLPIGTSSTVVEVTTTAPLIDTTTTTNQTNLNTEELDSTPHGYSFQSVIQFAPMARNEPLAGMTINGMASGGTGGSLPGSSGNGNAFGYSVGGAADSETTYLVEGQDTENISGGYSNANVPFQFIQEVQVKTSGIEAEHGGALGGVVDVIMKKGSNAFHGSIFSSYESSGLDGNPANPFLRYDPTNAAGNAPPFDDASQIYSAQKQHFRIVQPGFTVGGPILKDRLWFFAGFAPQYQAHSETVNFTNSTLPINQGLGNQYFTQDQQQYFGNARLDATLTQKIRVFGSWLYQYTRETGDELPIGDPISAESSLVNTAIGNPITLFSHGLGFAAPNATYNTGADITLTPKIVSTTRFGYFFQNYHDFGWPTNSPNLQWSTGGVGGVDNTGAPLPAALQQNQGTSTTPYLSSYTLYNASKHFQFDEDIAFFKSGWWGTHNFKFGYQLNHLSNIVDQNGNVPNVFLNVGAGTSHGGFTSTGGANCAILAAEWNGNCAGQYGFAVVQDFATVLPVAAVDWNHGLFAQDAWTVGHGVTLNLGIRIEHESLPAPGDFLEPDGQKIKSINFSWSDKIEPRLGFAWDVKQNGKLKVFASYGVVNDVMKLLLAQTSWGAQAYEQCSYALGPDSMGTFTNSDIDVVFKGGRACPSAAPTVGANFATGAPPQSFMDPSGVSLIENVNFRPWEPVAPNVKPYRQHEYVAGVDYQIGKDWAFEARYDRRRLDHILEDSSLADKFWGETYTIVNPGEGVNKTIGSYANFLTSLGMDYGVPGWAFNDTTDYGSGAAFGTCPSCPAMPKAIRDYDGIELRLTHATSKHWNGMFSYTWSRLWGNYSGLTTTDQSDGGITGRNSPDTTRSFDEPFYYFGANGKSNNGPLPTDRPNTLKANVYYQLPWGKHQTTTFGLFQVGYQGSPVSSWIDLTSSTPGEPLEATYIYGRGSGYVNVTQDPTTGAITLGNPYMRRTPWYTQSDFSFQHEVKTGEHQAFGFTANILNLFNQHSVTAYWQGLNSIYFATPLYPGTTGFYSGAALYQELETGYNPQTWINGNGGTVPAVTLSSEYGKPYLYQLSRNIRLGVHYNF